MPFRGPTLLLFGFCILLSPIALYVTSSEVSAVQSPQNLTTEHAQRVACEYNSIETAIGRIGCQGDVIERETRRTEESGAVFLRVQD